jgi:PRTRC genetic system protein A
MICPRYGAFATLQTDAHRFIVGGDGLYVEIRRAWLHAVLPISHTSAPLPYGRPPEMFVLKLHARQLVDGLRHFIARAGESSPQEHAAWLTFDPARELVGYVEPGVLSRSNSHVRYERPHAKPDALPVVDCHSHGEMGAFFSARDDQDDLGDDPKLAFVVGNLDEAEPSVSMRLVGLGINVDISEWVRAILYHEP